MVQLAPEIRDSPPMTASATSSEAPVVVRAGHRRIEVVRDGLRLRIRALDCPFDESRPLDEEAARKIATPFLNPGERLLDLLRDDLRVSHDLSDRTYTFLVWPRIASHTRAILDDSRSAA